jgi:predicted ATP-dependent endonuclease of OLD family
MINAVLFVEGIADVKFLQDFVRFHYEIELKAGTHIIECGGNTRLAEKKPQFVSSALNRQVNCIIFDADSEKQGTNFQGTKERINAELATIGQSIELERPLLKVEFDIFLFPNNSDDGDLETLLERTINPVNKPILDCWDGYERCLEETRSKIPNPITLPIRKSKIYSYTKLLLSKPKKDEKNDKAKEEHRDYTNEEHWTLLSSDTEPLKIFLDQYFQKESTL